MRYFSIQDVLGAIFSSSLLGLFAGGLYNSLSTLISCISGLLGILVRVLRSDSINCANSTVQHTTAVSAARKNVFDFIFFFATGGLYLLLCYLTLDGIHRFYVLLALIITFFISKKTLGVVFENIILFVYKIMYSIAFYIIYVLTYPLRIAFKLLRSVLRRPLMCALSLFHSFVFALHIAYKRRQIRRYFKSTPLI